MEQERVTGSQKDIKRIEVMELSVKGMMPHQEAAESLKLCRRQIIRIRKKHTDQGEMALIHGNRGRHPQHRTGEWIRHNVLRLYFGKGARLQLPPFHRQSEGGRRDRPLSRSSTVTDIQSFVPPRESFEIDHCEN